MMEEPSTQQTPAVLTYWFVTALEPGKVLRSEPRADRGFGRKYLAQLNPAWPITPIGSFPLNRSSEVSAGEFYIAGYPGVTVVQTWVEDVGLLSELDEKMLSSRPAPDVYVIAIGDGNDFGGFVHYSGGVVKRALSGDRNQLQEDIGLPEPFELPYWAGETTEKLGGPALPFWPQDIARAAERHWVGVDVSPDGPDIQVVGYAVDGRPEPKLDEHKPAPPEESGVEILTYDDYEIAPARGDGDEFVRLAEAAGAALRRVGRGVKRRGVKLGRALNERLRHTDRP
ncbi:hypothetical protein C3B44_08285 [Corynebacterium yudongzhengii]|uniref:Uncharacterized protein n=1 Tax=Corynebacterium yudongzhengii TaxID=2080740 RepID=A0A2U1T7Q5_9CORY|nr:hypothetical protein [Corynebacterium yudongzhengii]AWB82352.1 hypothetical protein C3B44_08285 [Corynebacterium yudongzhengii]PWC02029.1 hypothetical protein DF222_04090 [Corynebacterium yudongzhengii]